MRLAITGASGFVGRAVQQQARLAGWEVLRIGRTPSQCEILWDARTSFAQPSQLEGLDAVIHLAGESIFGLWTPAKKRAILESRAVSTDLLARTLAQRRAPPRALVSLSAIGYYGDRGVGWAHPQDPAGHSFLAQVCQRWEQAADPARAVGIRVTHPRLGMVLDPSGGALKTMIPAFRWGVGAVLGTGEQWMSWIGLHDAARALCWAAHSPQATGAWNLVSSQPIQQREFAHLLAQTLHRPCWLRIPAPLLRLLGGEFAQDLLLASCRAAPFAPLEKELSDGFLELSKIFGMIQIHL